MLTTSLYLHQGPPLCAGRSPGFRFSLEEEYVKVFGLLGKFSIGTRLVGIGLVAALISLVGGLGIWTVGAQFHAYEKAANFVSDWGISQHKLASPTNPQ